VYLTGEIIHNPQVNHKIRSLGIGFLTDAGTPLDGLGSSDVVILPAFGVTMALLRDLEGRGCTLVDTTCGSVLNVWKNVRRYCAGGFTSIIHGKYRHEETQATASQAAEHGGRYLVLLDRPETELVCKYIRHGGDAGQFLSRFGEFASPGFDPDRDLRRVGLANQTTMLMSESLEMAELIKDAMRARYGDDALSDHYQAFDTICSATQDRQDAVAQLLTERALDLVIVIGGYNSSNTCNLARLCAETRPTFHIAEPDCLLSGDRIRHRPAGVGTSEVTTPAWFPAIGEIAVGLTSGASTPDSLVGATVLRLAELAGSART
jgi:4-hydroxy-3-methylbut-2-enyl diphosphate reductase